MTQNEFQSDTLARVADKRFYSNEEVIVGTNAYFEYLSANYYKKGIVLLETRWNECIMLEVLLQISIGFIFNFSRRFEKLVYNTVTIIELYVMI